MLEFEDFIEWYPFSKLCLENTPSRQKNGFVYLFRKQDTKEVVYIGQSTNLIQRFFRNYIGGVGGGTTKRIHELLINKDEAWNIEVAWRESGDCESDENRLLRIHFDQRGRIPLWNKRLP